MSALLAVASSVLWGVADFLGGNLSQRVRTILVVLISQAAGLLLALLTAAIDGSFRAPIGYLPWAAGAGVAGAGAVLLFYRALAIGTMSIVAPLASLGVIVPVVIGFMGGTLPSALCLAGIVVAIGGVVISAGLGSPDPHGSADPPDGRNRQSILLAVAAAAGFGLLEYAIAGGAKHSLVMTMVGMRATSVPVLAVAAVLAVRSADAAAFAGEQFRPGRRLLALMLVTGLFDAGANLLFGASTVSGSLSVVAVLGSLYPAVTVLLARLVNGERMSRTQNLGVATAICGVALISLGS